MSNSGKQTKKFFDTVTNDEYDEKIMKVGERAYMFHTKSVDSDDDLTDTNMAADDISSDDDSVSTTCTAKTAKTDASGADANSPSVSIKTEDVEDPIDKVEVATQTGDKDPDVSSRSDSTVKSSPPKLGVGVLNPDRCDAVDSSDDEADLDKTKIKKLCNLSKGLRNKMCVDVGQRQLYGRDMLVSPPRSPSSPQDFIPKEMCDYCGRRGKNCMNQRFGRYCVAIVYRYYRANRRNGTFSEKGIVNTFKDAYATAWDRDLFVRNNSLCINNAKKEDITLPGYPKARSLIFAINMVMWEYMISDSQRAAGYDFSRKSRKAKKNSKK